MASENTENIVLLGLIGSLVMLGISIIKFIASIRWVKREK